MKSGRIPVPPKERRRGRTVSFLLAIALAGCLTAGITKVVLDSKDTLAGDMATVARDTLLNPHHEEADRLAAAARLARDAAIGIKALQKAAVADDKVGSEARVFLSNIADLMPPAATSKGGGK